MFLPSNRYHSAVILPELVQASLVKIYRFSLSKRNVCRAFQQKILHSILIYETNTINNIIIYFYSLLLLRGLVLNTFAVFLIYIFPYNLVVKVNKRVMPHGHCRCVMITTHRMPHVSRAMWCCNVMPFTYAWQQPSRFACWPLARSVRDVSPHFFNAPRDLQF